MNKDCIFFEVCQSKENCSVDCIRYAEMKYLIDNSGLPNNLKGRTILQPDKIDYEAFCTLADIKQNIVDFVKQGKNLYIYSHNTGNGKSSWLSKLLKSYFKLSFKLIVKFYINKMQHEKVNISIFYVSDFRFMTI